MRPSQHARTQAPPKEGAIKEAERLFARLELESALPRRYARLDEIPAVGRVWTPNARTSPRVAPGGVFSHLAEPAAPPLPGERGAVTMTWEKFQRTVLPSARTIEARIPNGADRFAALITAANADAPPMLAWDRPDARNPFSWYYASGIDAEIRRRLHAAGGRYEGVSLRFSLMWNNRNDLDAHAITPEGAHIYYMHKRACRHGGFLDVDMNVHGETDKPIENIRWETGQAPAGRYQFFVNLYRTHAGPVATPFTAEVEVGGRVYTIQGVTRTSNSNNFLPDMVKIADFVYAPGQPVAIEEANTQPASTTVNAWGVTPGTYVPVTAIVRSPNLWAKPEATHHGQHAFFVLAGCRDTQAGVGRGFFAEMLRSDLRPVRSVMEAYAARTTIADADQADACGIGISTADTGSLTLRVNGSALYTLDRWD